MITASEEVIDEKTDSANSQFIPHATSARRIAEMFAVEISTGLPAAEANRRIAAFGANRIKEKSDWRAVRLLLGQFSSVVVWLLAFAAGVAFFTENEFEGSAILAVLLLNAAIGFAIEWQARKALDALKKATRTRAHVRRGGREQIIDAENLTAGDLIILAAGDLVPADARIVEAANLRLDESTLTGESDAVEKSVEAVEQNAPLAERRSMLYLGTTVAAGKASAIVTAIGGQTEIGRIGKLVADAESGKTPLEKKLADLGSKLVYIVLGIAAIVFLAGYLRGDGVWLMLEVSISLAVAAVPEGLPAVTTLILALGVLRMARRNALVRKLSAVETLGQASVICTDKTGTLTENRMTVKEYRLANERLIEMPDGKRRFDSVGESASFSLDENLLRLLRVSILCNDAALETARNAVEKFIGDPTEAALLAAFRQFGFDVQNEKSAYRKLSEQPFDSKTKKMTTVFRKNGSGKTFAAIKGAPAVILGLCGEYLSADGKTASLTAEKRREFLQVNEEMASRALRVLAFADKNLGGENAFSRKDNFQNAVFLGFAGMTDPPRNGAAEAVRRAQAAGIRVVMLTGDQINTARAVARELNLSAGADVFAVHSDDLLEADGEQLAQTARQAHVFARVTPEDKLRIVEALQKAGEIVAVTGDGVNDAPALKQSDIGVAMGLRGTEVAKEAADIVLTDDNFSTIVKAIESGRAIYANIIKFVHLLFSDNFGEVLVIFAAILLGLPLPLLPLQILWVNLVTDVFPALALALEPVSPAAMRRPPHPPGEALLSARFLVLIFWKSVVSAAIVLAAYLWALQTYGAGAHSRTVALLSLIAVQIANLFNCRSRTRSVFDEFFSNPYIFAAVAVSIFLQFLAVYFAPLAHLLDTTVPNKIDYPVIGVSLILPVVIVEIAKAFSRRKSR